MKTTTIDTTHSYHQSFTTEVPVAEAFKKIGDVAAWWGTNVTGEPLSNGEEFTIRFGETFVSFLVTEWVPNKKIVWKVTDCNLAWIGDKLEWKDTEVLWELKPGTTGTQINFTHLGLVPERECYSDCRKGWDFHLKESLSNYLDEGKGFPDTPKDAR